MNYSLGNMLGRNMALGALDPDAVAYIAAVRAAGGTVSGAQATAISNFAILGKADGWFSSVKRFYLPIWGVAAANAVDLIARGSGTFVGGVTHSSGFVTFNGTTGAFRDNATIISHGSTSATHHTMALVSDNPGTAADFVRFFGAYDSIDSTKDCEVNYRTVPRVDSRCYGLVGNIISGSIATNLQEGVFLQNKLGTAIGTHQLKLLKTAGLAIDSASGLLNAVDPPASKMAWGARNSQADALQTFNNFSYGAMSVGVSIGNNALQNTYTTRIKTLWETCTGLTLP
jgi:hypothetical protein